MARPPFNIFAFRQNIAHEIPMYTHAWRFADGDVGGHEPALRRILL